MGNNGQGSNFQPCQQEIQVVPKGNLLHTFPPGLCIFKFKKWGFEYLQASKTETSRKFQNITRYSLFGIEVLSKFQVIFSSIPSDECGITIWNKFVKVYEQFDLLNITLCISTLRRLCAKYQVSRCPGREPSSCVSLASSKESRMTFLIPEWSLDDFEHQEGHILT